MINLTINVDDISTVLLIFDRVQVRKYIGTGIPDIPVAIIDYATVSGIDQISNRTDVSDVILAAGYSQYYFTDPAGVADSWYTSRYYSTVDGSTSAWTDSVLGETGDLFQASVYPPEIAYGTADQRVIDKIRILIGDPVGLNREYGIEAESSIHPDGRVYELDEKGWPASINLYNQQYNELANPSVNGYKFLKFQEAINTTVTTISGVEYSINIWYYTFRWSDREIMKAYDEVLIPSPLTITNATAEVLLLQTSYDLLISETWENLVEDGAMIRDEQSVYNPDTGLKNRQKMLDVLRKRLDDIIKSLTLNGITGVLID